MLSKKRRPLPVPKFMQSLSEYVAAQIIRGSKKRFSKLHGDFLQQKRETMKSTSCTTTGLAVNDSEASRHPVQVDADPSAATEGKTLASRYAGQPGINSGLAAEQNSQLRPVSVKPVDRRTIEGSTPGDFRAKPGDVSKASLMRAADNGGPRNDVGQFKGSKYETQPATQKYPGNLTDSQGGN
jgi:hypothetical protein